MKKLRFGLFENARPIIPAPPPGAIPTASGTISIRSAIGVNIARICEDAKLDFLFLADAWGWADVKGQRPETCTIEGLDLPRLDPAIVGAALIGATDKHGHRHDRLEPARAALRLCRRMQTLDHLSGGRIGWNVVTTGTAETAVAAFGVPMVAHDERYNMADDFHRAGLQAFRGRLGARRARAEQGGALCRSGQGAPHRP